MYSASGNYMLDVIFYKKETEIEIKNLFSAILTKSKSVAFSLLLSIYSIRLYILKHSQNIPWFFSPQRFCKFQSYTKSDWLNRMVYRQNNQR